jgi:quercetin 2,3-dioxygenase
VPGAVASVITVATGDGDRPSIVMTYSGEPIGQPVVLGGPFVMNSKAEIAQAFRDFHLGRFGDIPHQARLQYS